MQTTFYGHTDVGQVRAANEDNHGYAETEWGGVYIVCDGMGGHVGGATASELATRSLLEYLKKPEMPDPRQDLREAVTFANEQIYATALAQPDLKGMGTTCVVLLQKADEIWLAHVGDSRAYLYSGGKLHRITRDHSFVQGLVDEGLIDEEQAEAHPRKNELLQALGIRPECKVEVIEAAVLAAKGDLFLLCSDGLNGMIGNGGIEEIVGHAFAGEASLEELGQRLIDAANEAGGTDNITVQLLRVDDSPHSKSRFKAVTVRPDLAVTIDSPGAAAATAPPSPPPKPSMKRFILPVIVALAVIVGVLLLVLPGDKDKPPKKDKPPNGSVLNPDSLKKDTARVDTAKGAPADTAKVKKDRPKKGVGK